VSAETDVGIGVAAVAAIAAAVSAWWSARGVELSHRPYVYGERSSRDQGGVTVGLHNDGTGAAFEVRCRLGTAEGGPNGWAEPSRALQPGEGLSRTLALPMIAENPATDFYIETEYRDIRGARWRLRNDRSAAGGMSLTRLRRGWFDFWRESGD
jgi:hypothetical protein